VVGKRGHSSDRGRHRGPVGILRPELIEGSEGKLVDLGGIAMAKSSQCAAEHREEPGGSLSMPSKHEPIDFFGNCIVLVDRVASASQRGHPLLEIVIGQPCQERIGA